MAAISHTAKHSEAVAASPLGDAASALESLARAIMSQEAGSRRIEEAFMQRLLQVLVLAPHDVHDLAVSGKLGEFIPSNEEYNATVEKLAFKDAPAYRPGSGGKR